MKLGTYEFNAAYTLESAFLNALHQTPLALRFLFHVLINKLYVTSKKSC